MIIANKSISIGAMGLLLVLAACASSRGPPPGQGPGTMELRDNKVAQPLALLLVSMDRNFDRRLSREEFDIGLSSEWRASDSDENGQVRAFEHAEWAKAALGDSQAYPSWFAFDTNLNGELDPNEFQDRMRKEFARLDRNEDNSITWSELLTLLPTMGPRSGGSAPTGGRPPGGGRRPPGGGGGPPGGGGGSFPMAP